MGDDTKIELVANNSEDQVREATKKRLTADLNRTFGKMASNLLEFIRGNDTLDPDLMEEFRTAERAYFAEVGGEDFTDKHGAPAYGVPIRVFDFSKRPDDEIDPDDVTNTIIRGALGMVSALLLTPSPDTEAYVRANEEFAEGITKVHAKLIALKNPRTVRRGIRRP